MKSIFLVVSFLMFSFSSYAQNIYISFTDGTQEQFVLANVQNITFTGNNMRMTMVSGPIKYWNVLEIASYNYKGFTTIKEQNIFSELKLFPNPTSDELYIKFIDKNNYKISIELFDVGGELISTTKKTIKGDIAKVDLSKQIKDLSKGNYFCKINSGTHTITKKIIKN